MLDIFAKPVRRWVLVAWVAVVSSLGCNPTEKTYSLVEVQGTITLDQSPVSDAKIVFLPQRLKSQLGQNIPLAYGTTNEKGEFSLVDSEGNSNLATGEYLVIISKDKSSGGNLSTKLQQQASFLPPELAGFQIFNQDDETIPRWYNRDSELIYRVEGSAKIDRPKFELNSQRDAGRP